MHGVLFIFRVTPEVAWLLFFVGKVKLKLGILLFLLSMTTFGTELYSYIKYQKSSGYAAYFVNIKKHIDKYLYRKSLQLVYIQNILLHIILNFILQIISLVLLFIDCIFFIFLYFLFNIFNIIIYIIKSANYIDDVILDVIHFYQCCE